MKFSPADTAYMARALQLARKGLYTTDPNPRVGCVIVKHDVIIGEGWHERAGEPHAEVLALRQAGAAAKGATVYVTLEPCSHTGRTPPCANALVQAQVASVIVAMIDPNPQVAGRGMALLQAAGIHTQVGLLEAQARALNAGFISSMERKRPWVRLKMAMSLDGRTAMASGESVWITGESARRDVQFWRAQASAIVTGIGTIVADDPSLNVRLSAEELGIAEPVRFPARMILDSQLRFPLNAKLLQTSGEIHIVTVNTATAKRQALEAVGVKVHVLAGPTLELAAVLTLMHQLQWREIHVECGATLAGSWVEQGLVDEFLIYMAPHLMGSQARPLFNLPHLTKMAERLPLSIQDIRAVGEDWCILALPASLEEE